MLEKVKAVMVLPSEGLSGGGRVIMTTPLIGGGVSSESMPEVEGKEEATD